MGFALFASISSLATLAQNQADGVAAQELAAPLKIGIIGTGRIGGTLARYWVKAGNHVLVSSRHPEELHVLVRAIWAPRHVCRLGVLEGGTRWNIFRDYGVYGVISRKGPLRTLRAADHYQAGHGPDSAGDDRQLCDIST